MAGGRRRARTRPRYTRLGALLASVLVTGFAMVTGIAGVGDVSTAQPATRLDQAASTARDEPTSSPTPTATAATPSPSVASKAKAKTVGTVAVPSESGTGRRVVFDMSDQRVWLVRATGVVRATYLVSGSVTDNLRPGHYRVYSRSESAVGVNDSGTMKYFVRFTRGQNAAIGFHDIPIDNGQQVQSISQLGTPQSHGCIRQKRTDAVKLWDFAPVGTAVDVVA